MIQQIGNRTVPTPEEARRQNAAQFIRMSLEYAQLAIVAQARCKCEICSESARDSAAISTVLAALARELESGDVREMARFMQSVAETKIEPVSYDALTDVIN
jgi:hypothetical protein